MRLNKQTKCSNHIFHQSAPLVIIFLYCGLFLFTYQKSNQDYGWSGTPMFPFLSQNGGIWNNIFSHFTKCNTSNFICIRYKSWCTIATYRYVWFVIWYDVWLTVLCGVLGLLLLLLLLLLLWLRHDLWYGGRWLLYSNRCLWLCWLWWWQNRCCCSWLRRTLTPTQLTWAWWLIPVYWTIRI